MLKLTNLQKNYGDFHLDCTMEVRPGAITGFIGANGAGKSTTVTAGGSSFSAGSWTHPLPLTSGAWAWLWRSPASAAS